MNSAMDDVNVTEAMENLIEQILVKHYYKELLPQRLEPVRLKVNMIPSTNTSFYPTSPYILLLIFCFPFIVAFVVSPLIIAAFE